MRLIPKGRGRRSSAQALQNKIRRGIHDERAHGLRFITPGTRTTASSTARISLRQRPGSTAALLPTTTSSGCSSGSSWSSRCSSGSRSSTSTSISRSRGRSRRTRSTGTRICTSAGSGTGTLGVAAAAVVVEVEVEVVVIVVVVVVVVVVAVAVGSSSSSSSSSGISSHDALSSRSRARICRHQCRRGKLR